MKEHLCKFLLRLFVGSWFLLLAGSEAFPSVPVSIGAAERKSLRSWAGSLDMGSQSCSHRFPHARLASLPPIIKIGGRILLPLLFLISSEESLILVHASLKGPNPMDL